MIIDAHSHGFDGTSIDKLEDAGGDWAKKVVARERKRADDRPHYFDVAMNVERLNRLGYDLAVVTPLIFIDPNRYPGDMATRVKIAGAINDNMARLMAASKGKLLAVGTVPPDGMEHGSRQEMERAIKGLGLKGMNLPTNVHGRPLDAPEFEQFWAQVSALDIPVFTHPQDPVEQCGRTAEADYWLSTTLRWPFETSIMLCRLVFSGVMERYPNLKIIGHHLGGGMLPFFWGRINEVYDRTGTVDGLLSAQDLITTLPRPLEDYFSRFYYDTAVLGTAPVKCAYEAFGVDQLVFASDAPFGPEKGERRLKDYPAQIKLLGLPDAETEKIMSGNIRRVLKI